MRVTITGGSGFLAGRLAEDLSEKGHSIKVFTREINRRSKNFEQVSIDWDSEESLLSVCRDSDVVIHAAGINAFESNKNPSLAEAFNGRKTTQLAKVASGSGVKKFFYISTAHVYAELPVGVYSEESETRNKSPYATSHLMGEVGVLETDGIKNFQVVVLRVGNVYGAPAGTNSSCMKLVVNNFYTQALTSGKIIIESDAKSQRNFLSAKDFCSIFSQLIDSENLCGYSLINVGATHSRSLLQMANLVASDVTLRTKRLIEVVQHAQTDLVDHHFDLKINRLRQIGIEIEDNYTQEFQGLFQYLTDTVD
ncbi:WcaG Nucleoside-diphosphate-sugar epimerases [Candidatus Nanopelagicaceae bacterium]